MWWMSHPTCISLSWILAGIQKGGKKAKQTQHIQIFFKNKSTTTFTKSTKPSTQIMLWRLWNFLIFYSVPVKDVNPAIMYSLLLFSSFLPSGTNRQIAGFREGKRIAVQFPQYFTWTVQAWGCQLYLILPTTGHQVLYMLSFWKGNTSC